MRKKWLCSLLTAALLLSLFPTAALADEDGPDASAEGVVETVAEEQAVVDPELLEMLPSNDELFSAYVDLAFAGEDADVPSIFGVGDPAYNRLGEKEKEIYDDLKARIADVAANGGSTEFDISSHFDKFTLQASSYGGSLGSSSGGTLTLKAEVEADIEEKIKFDSEAVMNALLLDCPYELYWFKKSADDANDKRAGMGTFGRYSCSGVADSYIDVTPSMKVIFYVVPAYQAGGSDVAVQSEVTKTKTAAQEIVDKNYTSDYARLRGYMEAICNLVSYNDAAAKDDWTEGYGNPWQLIWVFDGDETTNVVCEGYAKAFQYLCDLTQSQKKFTDNTIESYIVTGTMAGGTGEGPHMWNIVSIGGKSYLVDVTNCDTGSIGAPDKLFLVGNATAGFNPSNDTITIDGVTNLTYQYDSDTVSTWGSEILTLADKAYRPYTPVATTVKILKGNKEITEDTLAIGSTATYTAKVLDQNDVEMTGEGVTWQLREPHAGVTVNENGLVTVTDEAKIGKVYLVVTSSGNTVENPPTAEITINITEKPAVITPIKASWIVDIPTHTYTGKAIEPGITLKNGAVTLDGSTDYTVEYSNNTNVGTATVKVTGKGNYSGTVEKNFTIIAAEIQRIDITAPTASIHANDEKNTSIASLKSLVTLPDKTKVFLKSSGDPANVDLNVTWQSPAESAFNKKGGTYTFAGTIQTGKNIKPYSGKLEAVITVEPVTVKSVTLANAALMIKANAIDDYELPTAGTVEYNEIEGGSITINWPANAKDTLKAAADKMGDASNTTVTLTAESVDFPDWATVPASFAMPTLTVTITNKEQAAVTFDNGTSLGGIYGGIFVEPEVTVNIGTATPDEEGVKFSYTGTTLNGAGYSSAEMPRDAGNYTVTATYEDSTYFGSASMNFSIDAKSIDLDWNGLGTEESPLAYSGAPMNITASIPAGSLLGEDTCTVTVTGGNQINAGTYTAKATLSNKNYKATNAEADYTIQKGDRNVYISDDKTDITGKTLNLYPATGLSKEILVSYSNVDDVDPKYQLTGNASAVKLTTRGNQATVTAVGNGSATLTVSFDETDNYKGVSVSCTIEAVAKPISQISIGSKDETVDLTAKLDGSTIKVVGLGDPNKVCVKLVPAEDVGITLEQSPDSDTVIANGDKITLKDGSNLIAEYTVDLSGVTKVPAGTSYEETESPATSAKPELNDTAAALAPESEGLTAATANELIDAAKKAIEAAGEGATVKVEASLQVQLQGMTNTTTEKVLSLEIKPVYVVKTTKGGNTITSETIPMTSALAASVTIKVTLPVGFPTDNLYAKHYNADGVTVKEFIRVVIVGGKATWEQDSFSKTDLVQDTRSVTVVFNNGTKSETLTFTPENVNDTLPNSGTSTGGWSIEGKTYTTLTDELLTLLVEKSTSGSYTVNKTDAPDTPVTPPVAPEKPSTPSTSGGSGGGGSSGTTNRKISFNSSSNGSVTYTPSNPSKGTKVTLTAKPKSGYVLDTLRVLDAKGNELELTKTSDGKYTFIMPDGKVTVDAKFAEEGSQAQTKDFPFTDAEDSWARDAIAWAYENGYVNGTSATTFNPNGSITRQQMWMILARLSGASPANMTEAREWAMSSGVTDGTNGGNAMTRQQMVTFLYRYAQNRGYTTGGGTSLDSFPDNATVSAYAREPLAWAVGNGIVAGTSDGNLNPGGGATRAQFAMILQRFYNNTVES